jgi:hypothetical protein
MANWLISNNLENILSLVRNARRWSNIGIIRRKARMHSSMC